MKNTKLNDKMKTVAQGKLLTAQAAQQDFQSYVRGCMDGLGLNGDYNLNIQEWTFELVEKKGDSATQA